MSAFKRKIQHKFYFAAVGLLSHMYMSKAVSLSVVAETDKQPEWPSTGNC